MINNDTPASPVNGAVPQDFFNAKSQSNTSSTFTVGPAPFYLRAYNLNSGDVITVQVVGGSGSGSLFAPFAPLGTPIALTPGTPEVRLDWPGQYRLIFSGTSVTAITVSGYPAQSSEPTIYTLGGGGSGSNGFTLIAADTASIDLNFTGTSAGGTLVGAVKLSTSTGNILSGTPTGIYGNVSIVAGQPLQISGNGSSASPYDLTANIFPMPPTNLTDWPNTFITAINLQGILFVTDSPYEMADFGVGAGEQSVDSSGEVCVGYHAGTGIKGDFKVVIGHSALNGATTAASGNFLADVIIGHRAGFNAVRATLLSEPATFIGEDSGNGAHYAAATFIGRGAGSATSSTSFVAIGDSAGASIVGDHNVIIGNQAASGTVHTGNSVVIGDGAAEGVGAGDGIIAIGVNAGTAATPGTGNTNGNIYIGSFAGSHDTHQDVIIIASDATTAINSSADHQIILGKSSHTELRTAGSIIAGGAISASDARLKDNVVTIGNAIEIIDQLRPVYFHWDQQALEAAKLPYRPQDCGKNISGFIAQELEKVIPELIENTQGGDGKVYNFVHYDRIIGLAFAGIKELIARNKALETRVADLELKGK